MPRSLRLSCVAFVAVASLAACSSDKSTDTTAASLAVSAETTLTAETVAPDSSVASETTAVVSDSTAAVADTQAQSGPPGGGAGGAGGGGVGQTFTAVNLNSDGVSPGGANTADVVKAANDFLATLDATAKSAVVYEFSNTQAPRHGRTIRPPSFREWVLPWPTSPRRSRRRPSRS